MNENLNLVEILKDCPEGTKLYSTVYGDVELVRVYLDDNTYPIEIKIDESSDMIYITNDGRLFDDFRGECTLFPSTHVLFSRINHMLSYFLSTFNKTEMRKQ